MTDNCHISKTQILLTCVSVEKKKKTKKKPSALTVRMNEHVSFNIIRRKPTKAIVHVCF